MTTKGLSVGWQTALAQDTTYLVSCIKVTWRVDAGGNVFGFTTHTKNLTIDGVVYEAASSFLYTEVSTTAGLNVDNMEVAGALRSESINILDVMMGRWDGAAVEMFVVDYTNLALGKNYYRVGNIGEIRWTDYGFEAELLGLMNSLQMRFQRAYLPGCDATLGDTRCGVDLGTFTDGTVSATVTGVTSQAVFTASSITQATGWFADGYVLFTSGANDGVKADVKWQTNAGVITLQLSVIGAINVGDTFDIVVGCSKSFEMCKAKFANGERFRGFPWLPGVDRLISGV